ncbi:hypothetical protein SAMN05661044_01185 [Olivibacter domesticus]|uniref:Uncharacterized protein n=1 Tax=Olivibacter domesticus TaxID=407022 RepID=A0A1H7K0T8_OLID1|nr:hypothetical protein SAMN05661044_01185 [Olivibacter domesticus]
MQTLLLREGPHEVLREYFQGRPHDFIIGDFGTEQIFKSFALGKA